MCIQRLAYFLIKFSFTFVFLWLALIAHFSLLIIILFIYVEFKWKNVFFYTFTSSHVLLELKPQRVLITNKEQWLRREFVWLQWNLTAVKKKANKQLLSLVWRISIVEFYWDVENNCYFWILLILTFTDDGIEWVRRIYFYFFFYQFQPFWLNRVYHETKEWKNHIKSIQLKKTISFW